MENEFFTGIQLELIKEEFLNHIEGDFDIPLETIFKWIDCLDYYEKYINDNDFRETFCQLNIYKLKERDHYVMMNKNNINTPLFTLKGFNSFCQFYNAKSRFLGNFLTKIETQNKNNKFDNLVKNTIVLAKTIKQMQKEIIYLNREVDYLNREVDYLKQEVRNNRN